MSTITGTYRIVFQLKTNFSFIIFRYTNSFWHDVEIVGGIGDTRVDITISKGYIPVIEQWYVPVVKFTFEDKNARKTTCIHNFFYN